MPSIGIQDKRNYFKLVTTIFPDASQTFLVADFMFYGRQKITGNISPLSLRIPRHPAT
jgi:hypothetical protein